MTLLSGLYEELAKKIGTEIPEIKWVDTWQNQLPKDGSEPAFPSPAVFIDLKSLEYYDMGDRAQTSDFKVDFLLFAPSQKDYTAAYETSALSFMELLDRLHKTFHATDGNYYASMHRTKLKHKKSYGTGNFHRLCFGCMVNDASTACDYVDVMVNDVNVERGE
ncbi:MAG: hypothetical protein ACK5L5_04050 [Bacteroidales bacterium]